MRAFIVGLSNESRSRVPGGPQFFPRLTVEWRASFGVLMGAPGFEWKTGLSEAGSHVPVSRFPSGSRKLVRQFGMPSPADEVRFNWWTQIYLVVGALVVLAGIDLLDADASLFAFLLIWAILSACIVLLLIYAALSKNRHRARRPLLTLAILWTISALFFEFERSHPIAIRSAARWLAGSRQYKAQVLAEPEPPSGELKYIEWDGWGMFAQDTSVYLVYDPTDSLSAAAMSHKPGKFDHIPCKAQLVRRLENQWYSVIFYTSETWGGCQQER
jgi:hypothetical protein